MSNEEFLADLPIINIAVGTQEIATKETKEDDPKVSTSLEDTLKDVKCPEIASDQATAKKEKTAQSEVNDSKEAAAQVEIIKAGLIDFLGAQGGKTTSDDSTSDIFRESPGFPMYSDPCTAPTSPEPPRNQEKKPRMSDEDFLAVINFTPSSQSIAVKEPEESDPKVSTSVEDTLKEVKCPEAASEQATSKKACDEIAPPEVDSNDAAAPEDKLQKESGDSLVAPEGSVPKSDAPQKESKEFKEPTARTEPSTAPSSPEPTRTQKRKLRRVIVSRFPTRTTRGKTGQDSDDDRPLAQMAGSSDTSEPKPKQSKNEEK